MIRQLLCLSLMLVVTQPGAVQRLNYAGSSTIGKFVTDAAAVYRTSLFNVSTLAESAYGERCAQAGSCDIGGVAREIDLNELVFGVSKTLIGWDMVAIITHRDNPVSALSLEQLQQIYNGEIGNWSQLGGPDLPVLAYTVRPASATYQVFSDRVLGGRPYKTTRMVDFDAKMAVQVAREQGAIGMISFSFIRENLAVKAVAINGVQPGSGASGYPITRPLYLLLPPEKNPAAEDFVDWAVSVEGQQVVQKHFVGVTQE